MRSVLASMALCSAPLHAQTYADIAVSQGDNALGTIRIRLEHEKTPTTVANFIGLATGQHAWINGKTGKVETNKPFYDGLMFHRLIHNFVIQGGDQLETGGGNPGYNFADEFDASLRHTGRYLLSMANSGTHTNGSQFFITLETTPWLDDKHSIFGEVIDDATYPNSRTIIDGFTSTANFPTGGGGLPATPIIMTSVSISGPDLAGFDLDAANIMLPKVTALPFEFSPGTNGALPHLSLNQTPNTIAKVLHSTDLKNWSEISQHLDSQQPASNRFVLDGTGPREFFRPHFGGGIVELPADATFPSHYENGIFSITSGTNQFEIDLSGEGSLKLNDTLYGITNAEITSDGYGVTILVFTKAISTPDELIPLRFIMRADLPITSPPSGGMTGVGFRNPPLSNVELSGTFTFTPTP